MAKYSASEALTAAVSTRKSPCCPTLAKPLALAYIAKPVDGAALRTSFRITSSASLAGRDALRRNLLQQCTASIEPVVIGMICSGDAGPLALASEQRTGLETAKELAAALYLLQPRLQLLELLVQHTTPAAPVRRTS